MRHRHCLTHIPLEWLVLLSWLVLQARSMIVERAETIGLDWAGAMRDMQAQDWPARMRSVQDPAVSYPSYYTKPFHAYTEVRPAGNAGSTDTRQHAPWCTPMHGRRRREHDACPAPLQCAHHQERRLREPCHL